LGGAAYQYDRLAVALAHAAVVAMLCRAGALRPLTSRLAAVGRMALTNCIMQTVICTTLFYGFGFGLFGRLERAELMYVVAAIWAFQLAASPLWLARFRLGPLEWVWRSLTYWERQPMRRGSVLRPERHVA
jgi:uncharacterized protein